MILPARFIDLKKQIASSYPNFQERVSAAWVDILQDLKATNEAIVKAGPDYIPRVSFADLQKLSSEQREEIKRKGGIVITDVVDDDEAAKWKSSLDEFRDTNPDAPGFPQDNKQFFNIYWSKAQVLARSHPNVLEATVWLNNLYHTNGKQPLDENGVDLSKPLTYADRYRIRHPGGKWDGFPPHVDGGSIERWEDETFRTCFANILSGEYKKHDPYDLQGRLEARSSLYGRPNQSSIFRTFQGWLALSNIGPGQGTLKIYPDVLLSNAYNILRPFFNATVPEDSLDILNANNWIFDISTSEFPGIEIRDGGFVGPRPTTTSHPHLDLPKTMTSVPPVKPGDMVYWHCDVIHSVEEGHDGIEDSAVMYIPAVPHTAQNAAYVQRQKAHFIDGLPPPDFPQTGTEAQFVGVGGTGDVFGEVGKRAMGLVV